jgi:hypothetical protein
VLRRPRAAGVRAAAGQQRAGRRPEGRPQAALHPQGAAPARGWGRGKRRLQAQTRTCVVARAPTHHTLCILGRQKRGRQKRAVFKGAPLLNLSRPCATPSVCPPTQPHLPAGQRRPGGDVAALRARLLRHRGPPALGRGQGAVRGERRPARGEGRGRLGAGRQPARRARALEGAGGRGLAEPAAAGTAAGAPRHSGAAPRVRRCPDPPCRSPRRNPARAGGGGRGAGAAGVRPPQPQAAGLPGAPLRCARWPGAAWPCGGLWVGQRRSAGRSVAVRLGACAGTEAICSHDPPLPPTPSPPRRPRRPDGVRAAGQQLCGV